MHTNISSDRRDDLIVRMETEISVTLFPHTWDMSSGGAQYVWMFCRLLDRQIEAACALSYGSTDHFWGLMCKQSILHHMLSEMIGELGEGDFGFEGTDNEYVARIVIYTGGVTPDMYTPYYVSLIPVNGRLVYGDYDDVARAVNTEIDHAVVRDIHALMSRHKITKLDYTQASGICELYAHGRAIV